MVRFPRQFVENQVMTRQTRECGTTVVEGLVGALISSLMKIHSLVLIAALAWAASACASTIVYVSNRTSLGLFALHRQSGAPLRRDAWHVPDKLAVLPGQRSAVLRFNRDDGITAGQRFRFESTIFADFPREVEPVRMTTLVQELEGLTLGSQLTVSVQGCPPLDESSTEVMVGRWRAGDRSGIVTYRMLPTATDPDVELIFEETLRSEVQGSRP